MRNNNISKFLTNQYQSFLYRIPEDLRDSVIKHSFITGGALYSLKMYRKKQHDDIEMIVNDYDIYFDNKSVLINIVRQYVKWYHEDIEKYIEYGSEEDGLNLEELKKLKIIYSDATGKIYDETDYFADDNNKIFLKIDVPEALYALLKKHRTNPYRKFTVLGNVMTYVTGHSLSIGKYQIITRFVGTPKVIHSFFDFDHAKGLYIPNTGVVSFPESIIEAMYEKKLVYSGSKYPVASMFRIIKFLNRGFTVTKIEILKILFQIMQMDFTNKETLYDQLEGFYGDDLIPEILTLDDNGVESNIFDDIIKTLNNKIDNKWFPVENTNIKNKPKTFKEENDLPF